MTSRPFIFDTEFDAAGVVVQPSAWQPAKRAFSPAEVEGLVAQARQEAREAALAESAGQQAQALAAIAQSIAHAAPALAQIARTHREQSAELALAALERFPAGPLQAALEALGRELDASPRLVVRAAGIDGDARARVEALCADAGFTGLVAFRDEPGLPPASFRLEWADGRAEFDAEAAFARMAETLESALAAEAGHAETLTEGRP